MMVDQAHIWNHTFSYINSTSLKCAIQLGFPYIIHSNGQAMTLSDLVDTLPINNNAKTMIFNQAKENDKEQEVYLLTLASRLLLKDEQLSQVPYVQMSWIHRT
ncbi:hypothetical protein MTR67_039883 [Solanum verrucosum]|uniref:O-methyltransferase dimerisation domain-containing protein n=1 Tax=Solanum verrucosum TaxID=315347 RepID=A0AAF0UJD6_SOLVR|nr:hypothetical protein MTR67_039883 [Solanum verrucosum]